jgi:hypothetical protein
MRFPARRGQHIGIALQRRADGHDGRTLPLGLTQTDLVDEQGIDLGIVDQCGHGFIWRGKGLQGEGAAFALQTTPHHIAHAAPFDRDGSAI